MLVDTFFARQPILDRRSRVQAYEVLYRSGPTEEAGVIDGAAATAQVLAGAFGGVEVPDLLAGKPGFVNLPRSFIVDRALLAFPPERVGAEVLEDVAVDGEVIDALRELRRLGYSIALDDYVPGDHRIGLVPYVDIVKVDIRRATPAELASTARLLRSMGVRILAEKVETADEFDRCSRLDFDLFQGYFFARPELVAGRRLDEGRSRLVGLLAELHRPELTLQQAARGVESHPNLAFHLLRVLNSASFGLSRPVDSIREAVVMLGLRRVRELASVLVLASHQHKPIELLNLGLSRARMCEMIAERLGRADTGSFFTVGVFSVLDALADRPMAEVVRSLPLAQDVQDALVERRGRKGEVLEAAIAYERAAWEAIPDIGVDARTLCLSYVEALDWAGQMIRTVEAA